MRIITLHCNQTEDDTGSDEIRLWVSGTRSRDYYRDMNNGQTWDINDEVEFTTRARVEVWDQDAGRWWDPHDRLGTHVIPASMVGEGIKSAIFNAYGSNYDLQYEVIP